MIYKVMYGGVETYENVTHNDVIARIDRTKPSSITPMYETHNVVATYTSGSRAYGTNHKGSDYDLGEVYLDNYDELYLLSAQPKHQPITNHVKIGGIYDVTCIPLVRFFQQCLYPKMSHHASIMTLESEYIDVTTLREFVDKHMNTKSYLFHASSYIESLFCEPTPKRLVQGVYAVRLLEEQLKHERFTVDPNYQTFSNKAVIDDAIANLEQPCVNFSNKTTNYLTQRTKEVRSQAEAMDSSDIPEHKQAAFGYLLHETIGKLTWF